MGLDHYLKGEHSPLKTPESLGRYVNRTLMVISIYPSLSEATFKTVSKLAGIQNPEKRQR